MNHNRRKIKKLKKELRILKHWRVYYHAPTRQDRGACCTIQNKQKSTIYGWDKKYGKEPKDFILHELLHSACRALTWIDRRYKKVYMEAEEQFVEDICKLIYKS